MANKNPLLTSAEEPFVVGTDNLSGLRNRLQKSKSAAILFCRSGWASIIINLTKFEIIENTITILLPNNIFSLEKASDDFLISYFCFSDSMFREATFRLEPNFFRFIKKKPCYTPPQDSTGAVNGLMKASAAIYADRENCFRQQIAKNHLQCFLLDTYDKTQRWFTRKQIDRSSRQDELFNTFITSVHTNCSTQRDVTFYANELCISTKYLTNICHNITGLPAKKLIDNMIILEIKVLLQSTELTIQEIADKLNFPDQSYLGRYFKRHEGASPIDYRSKYAG